MTDAALSRRREIAAGLEASRRRIQAAEAAVGRAPESVGLVVVTKTFPATDVAILAELGVRDVGENRDQEAAPKAAAVAELDLTWHFIGQLQTNKVRSVVRYASVVESVDRPKLVAALSKAAEPAGRTIECLVQVDLDPAAGLEREGGPPRGGAAPQDVPRLADAVAAAPGLKLGGVMAVAPLGHEPERAFGRLAVVAEALRADHPGATVISAGMSGDLEAAIHHGATHVRLGSAILGYRPPVG